MHRLNIAVLSRYSVFEEIEPLSLCKRATKCISVFVTTSTSCAGDVAEGVRGSKKQEDPVSSILGEGGKADVGRSSRRGGGTQPWVSKQSNNARTSAHPHI